MVQPLSSVPPAPVGMSLCIDGDEFWPALADDIRTARDSVFVQTLSFEGDAAGEALAGALLASRARDRRIVVDSFTKYMLNDRLLYSPAGQLDLGLRREAWRTRRMVRRLRAGGVGVTFVWPIRGLLHRLPVRNHKKLVTIDDRVAYLGGINFSEHNFAWHDLMLRVEEPGVARLLQDDFRATWRGEDGRAVGRFDGVDVFITPGRGDSMILDVVADLIGQARRRIYLQCPYITYPFFELLHAARRRGVDVTVVTSEIHNRTVMRWAILEACRRADLEVSLYQGRMTHLKAMLVDDAALVLGSANFDIVGYRLQPEIVAVVREPTLLAEFAQRIMRRDRADSTTCNGVGPGRLRGAIGLAAVAFAGRVLEVTSRF